MNPNLRAVLYIISIVQSIDRKRLRILIQFLFLLFDIGKLT